MIFFNRTDYAMLPFNPEIPTFQGVCKGPEAVLGLRGIKFPDTIT